MDVMLLATAVALILASIICYVVSLRLKTGESKENRNDVHERAPPGRPVRRAAGQRVARRRMQANVNAPVENEGNGSPDEANDEEEDKLDPIDQKLGAKKRAKLAAKAEKKVQREAADRDREEKKKREQLLQDERDKQSEKEKAEEQRLEEAEKQAREEKERQEHEEYLKMKEAFSVEEEGFEEEDHDAEENLLQQFVDYIKENKVVVLEDLGAQFDLRTASVVERIQELQATGVLTGVIDDRGKFIYISQEELAAVAKFVRQRGRISITELAENSNKLINLNSGKRGDMVEAR